MKNLRSILFIVTLCLVFFATNLNAQPQDPPGDPTEGGGGPIGGNAPIESGIAILLALGTVYGGRKTYLLTKKEKTDE